MLNNIIEISKDELLQRTTLIIHQGYRFVTVTCVDSGEYFELTYHFDKDYQLENYRLKLPKGETLPSISTVINAAFIVENEMKDLFGIPVSGLIVDYEGKFMLAEGAPRAPLCSPGLTVVKNTPPAESGGTAAPEKENKL